MRMIAEAGSGHDEIKQNKGKAVASEQIPGRSLKREPAIHARRAKESTRETDGQGRQHTYGEQWEHAVE